MFRVCRGLASFVFRVWRVLEGFVVFLASFRQGCMSLHTDFASFCKVRTVSYSVKRFFKRGNKPAVGAVGHEQGLHKG